MKQNIFKSIIATLLIITLTMADFLLLCVNAVTYAIDEYGTEGRSTNHRNVEFVAYFVDENGNKVTSLDTATNNENLKLGFNISVLREGYFNGNIVLSDSNFKFKPDLSDGINKIEDNTIYLNQINAGESKDFEVGIELLKDQNFDLSMIDKTSKVTINGVYKDSTEKDIQINSERQVELKFVSTDKDGITLEQNIITNKVMSINGENKRVIQINVKSGINENLFPIKTSKINVTAPKINDKYPEKVLVNSNTKLVTNGKQISTDNWNYDSSTGVTSINIENLADNNIVSWIKNGTDDLIVTYIYDANATVTSENSKVDSEIALYDGKDIGASVEKTIGRTEVDSIVTSAIEQSEAQIYKGKLYAGISRDITYKDIIDINLNNVASEITINEKNQKINDNAINSTYKNTTLNKENLQNILQDGASISIVNGSTNAVITTIDNNTEAGENGIINVTYPDGVYSIAIKIDGNVNIGRLEITNTKTIGQINKNVVKGASSIYFENGVSYISNNKTNTLNSTASSIGLLETETSADLQINRNEFSTMTSNDNVEFRITLNSKDEKNELFKNPKLVLTLPEKFTGIQINSAKLLYEDELQVKSASLNGNKLEISLEGEQTKYKDEAIDGALILVSANLSTEKTATSSTEQVTLSYTNDNAINIANNGVLSKEIKIISNTDIITTNKIQDLGIDIINNEGTSTATLEVGKEAKTVDVQEQIINNKPEEITNVRLLGTLPTAQAFAENNIDTTITGLEITDIDASKVKVYYTENANADYNVENTENGWQENITDGKNVKKYLIVIDKLAVAEGLNLKYQINIPENLENNATAKEGYSVYFVDGNNEQKVDTTNIQISTPTVNKIRRAPTNNQTTTEATDNTINNVIENTTEGNENTESSNNTGNTEEQSGDLILKLESVDDNNGVIKSGYPYRYILNVKNNTSEILKDINLEFTVNENATINDIFYVETENSIHSDDKKNIKISKLEAGQEIEICASVSMNVFKDVNTKPFTIFANATVNNNKFESNIIKQNIESDLLIKLDVSSKNSGEYVNAGDMITYDITIKNNGKNDTKNTTLYVLLPNDVTLFRIIKDTTTLTDKEYSLTSNLEEGKQVLKLEGIMNANQEIKYKIDVLANLTLNSKETKELVTEFKLNTDGIELDDTKIQHILKPLYKNANENSEEKGNNSENSNNSSNNNSEEKQNGNNSSLNTDDENISNKNISGYVWIDENKNGQKDNNEQAVQGIKIRLLNTSNNTFEVDENKNEITATTSETGFYNLSNVPKGKYIVIFEYDTDKYDLTTYSKEGVESNLNSKVISKILKEDNTEKEIGASQIIDVNDDVTNINMGLVKANTYDLKLDKYITKVTVQNKNTTTKTFTDETLAKMEIDAKQINSTIVIVEYTIRVTNNGDVSAYVKKIADYLSSEFKFNSELNKDWYQSGDTVYCTGLANQEIKPGESKEVKLIVVKQMNENNTGLINNSAEIVESYNQYGLKDVNSTEGNKVIGEDDMGSADLIIAIKTGQIVLTVFFIILTIGLLAVCGVFTYRKINNKKLF